MIKHIAFMKYDDLIDHVLNGISTCLKGSRGSPVKHLEKMTDASKVVIRGGKANSLPSSKLLILNIFDV